MLGEDHYLIVSNAQNGGSEQDRLTVIYRLQVGPNEMSKNNKSQEK